MLLTIDVIIGFHVIYMISAWLSIASHFFNFVSVAFPSLTFFYNNNIVQMHINECGEESRIIFQFKNRGR